MVLIICGFWKKTKDLLDNLKIAPLLKLTLLKRLTFQHYIQSCHTINWNQSSAKQLTAILIILTNLLFYAAIPIWFISKKKKRKNWYTDQEVISTLEFLLDNIYLSLLKGQFFNKVSAFLRSLIVPLSQPICFFILINRNSFKILWKAKNLIEHCL